MIIFNKKEPGQIEFKIYKLYHLSIMYPYIKWDKTCKALFAKSLIIWRTDGVPWAYEWAFVFQIIIGFGIVKRTEAFVEYEKSK